VLMNVRTVTSSRWVSEHSSLHALYLAASHVGCNTVQLRLLNGSDTIRYHVNRRIPYGSHSRTVVQPQYRVNTCYVARYLNGSATIRYSVLVFSGTGQDIQ
jgi:hypothetical protein